MTEASETDVSFIFDTDIASYTSSAIKGLAETTRFKLVLHGLRTAFNRLIQSKALIEYTFTDRYKEFLLEKSKGKLTYPYAFITVNDVDLVKDQINTSAMARHGAAVRAMRANSVPVIYVFPFKMNITLNILDSDINSLLCLMQSAFLADVSHSFNFKIRAFSTESIVKVQRTSNISFAEATINTEQENDYATGHITCTFEVQGQMGFDILAPTIRGMNINVYTVEDKVREINHLDFSYRLDFSEDPDGTSHINKLYIAPSG